MSEPRPRRDPSEPPVDLIDAAAADTVRPLASAIAVVFAIYAVGHWWMLPSDVARVVAPAVAATAALAAAVRIALARRSFEPRRAHAICTGFALLAVASPLLHLAVQGRPLDTIGLMFLVVGSGMLVLWTPGFALVVATAVVGWSAAARATPPAEQWRPFGLALLGTIGLASLIHYLRVRSLSKQEVLRRREAETGEHLRQALKRAAAEVEQRRRVERELRASEERYRLVAEHTRDLIWTLDADGRLTYLSPAVETMLGWPPDCCVGCTIEDLQLTPESLPRGRDLMARLRSGEVDEAVLELEHRTRWGGTLWTEVSASARRREDGSLEAVYAVSRDVSERKRAQEALRRALDEAEAAARAKSRFLAVLSHEIRTPMNGVIGMTELLLDSQLTPAQREHAETIRGSAEVLLQLIDDILEFSRAESGSFEIESLDLEPATLIRGVVDRFAGSARARGLSLVAEIEEGVPERIRSDPRRLRQMLDNLVANGIKFTERGGVRLRARRSDAAELRLRFEVIDTGIGISDEERLRIFKPFVQADASTTRRYGGTGLGLAICAHIAQRMGAEIGVESEPGRGSAFWIELPYAPARPGLPDVGAAPASGEPPRILVADDNAVNRQLAVEMLARLGFAAAAVESGRAALEAIDREPFAAVLMDVQMPEMDGFQAAARIRERERGRPTRTPVVAMTAHAGAGERERCLADGMDDYLSKPLRLGDLAAVLERRVDRKAVGADGADRVRSALARRTGDDDELSRQLVRTFLESYPDELDGIAAALRGGDPGAMERIAHSLRGSADTLGLEAVSETARRLESLGREGRLDGAEVALAALTGELIQLRAQLDALLREAG